LMSTGPPKIFFLIARSFTYRQIISADVSCVNSCSDSALANFPLLFCLEFLNYL
jgi:hypothetical protein